MMVDTLALALGLAFVGFAVLVILTAVSARDPAAEQRRELQRMADQLARTSAKEEAARRRRLGLMSLEQEEAIRRQNLAAFDDGT